MFVTNSKSQFVAPCRTEFMFFISTQIHDFTPIFLTVFITLFRNFRNCKPEADVYCLNMTLNISVIVMKNPSFPWHSLLGLSFFRVHHLFFKACNMVKLSILIFQAGKKHLGIRQLLPTHLLKDLYPSPLRINLFLFCVS